MTWLFPEPELEPGEEIEWKAKVQLDTESGKQTTGVIYLTNRNLCFVPGRRAPSSRNVVTRFTRADCVDVAAVEGRFGYGVGQDLWQCVKLTFTGSRSVSFWVKHRDATVALLRQELSKTSRVRDWPPPTRR